jgi:integrase
MGTNHIHVYVLYRRRRPFPLLQWVDPETGKRKTVSAGTADPKGVEEARAEREYELNHGRYVEPSRISWEEFRDLFEKEYAAGLRQRTQEKFTTVLDVFEQIVGPAKLRNITERTLSRFVQGMRERKRPNGKIGLAPVTMKNYLIALKTALAWAVEQKLLPAVPNFPTVKVPKKKPQPVPAESFEKLLAKAPDDSWRAYLLCGWWAGLRLSEALHLEWEGNEERPWVDLANNKIVLPAVFAKSAQDQTVPLHPVLREALEQLPRSGRKVFGFRSRSGRPLKRSDVTHRIQRMAKDAGVKLSMHRLRKGFGCRVAKQLGKGGAPVLHVLMRHASMQVTMDYYASVDDALQDVIRELR